MRVRVLTPLNFGGRRYGSGETIDIPHDCPLQQLAEIERWASNGSVRHMPPDAAAAATAPMDTASAAPLVPERHLGSRRAKAKR